jgi:hypothetical protein
MTSRCRTSSDRSRRPGHRAVVVTLAATLAIIAGLLSAPRVIGAAHAAVAAGSPAGAAPTMWWAPGGMRVTGWAVDPNTVKPLSVYVTVDGKKAVTVTANKARAGIPKAYAKAGRKHGFDTYVRIIQGRHTVCVYAHNVGRGADTRLRCQKRNLVYNPQGAIQSLKTGPGSLIVSGWVYDREKPRTPLTVTVTVDKKVTTLLAKTADAAAAKALPAAGRAHGFAVRMPLAQGTHRVCVVAKNLGYGADTTLRCTTITLNESPRGALDTAVQQAGRLHITGWAYDPDAATAPLTVTIKVGTTSHTVVARTARPDLARAYPAAGKYHGFDQTYTLPEGTYRVCVTARNVSYGSNVTFTCRTAVLNFTPSAALTALTATATGATVTGWASDPDTSAAISIDLTVDGHTSRLAAAGKGASHSGHLFTSALTLKSGKHTVCATALNVLYGSRNSTAACKTIALALRPIGKFESIKRATGSTNLSITGWTLDPDTTSPLSVAVTLDGKASPTLRASVVRTDVAKTYPAYGASHGISAVLIASTAEHTVCLTAKNVDGGSDASLGCKEINAVHPVAPSTPQKVAALAGYGGATISWSAPATDGGAPWSKYTVVASPGGATVTVAATGTSATVTGLKPSTSYSFKVSATNVAGTSPAATSAVVKTQASPPAQKTPAPVSTSRYIRNIRTATAAEQAKLKAEGAADAKANPSGHGYLILLDIGGQDQADGGVVLSATTRFVTYASLLTDLQAYVDGYHSSQRASAPLTLAIGTNNDMDVSAASGKAWATRVITPLASYARRYTGISVAGANDIEPGFRATYAQTKNWLGGYLAATSAPFVFNGSADGCAWTVINRGCNNGWTMAGLYYLAAGAAPVRMLNLPQVYNTTMAGQWKYISLTGVATKKPRINFAGTLTEWTACDQSNSCGSLTGRTAWSAMWSNLQSDSRLKVSSLPYATDLRIDS